MNAAELKSAYVRWKYITCANFYILHNYITIKLFQHIDTKQKCIRKHRCLIQRNICVNAGGTVPSIMLFHKMNGFVSRWYTEDIYLRPSSAGPLCLSEQISLRSLSRPQAYMYTPLVKRGLSTQLWVGTWSLGFLLSQQCGLLKASLGQFLTRNSPSVKYL